MLLIFKSHVGMTSASCRDEMFSLSPFFNLHKGFPCDSAGKESACNVEVLGSIPGSGKSPEEGMAIHSSILAWKIPWTEEPSEL